jgi:hypothetical protein
MWVAKSASLVEIGLNDLPKSRGQSFFFEFSVQNSADQSKNAL